MKKFLIIILLLSLNTYSHAQSWTPLNPPNRNYYGVWFDSTNTSNGYAVSWYIAAFDYIPYAIHTSNGGSTFTPMQTFCAGQDIWFTNWYTGVIVGNGINQTTDGGNTWNIIEDVTAMQAGWLKDVMFTNATDGYSVGQRYDFNYMYFEGMIYKTNNAGGSWTNYLITEEVNGDNTDFQSVYSTGSGVVYAGCISTNPGTPTLYKSTNDGVTWSPLSFTENTLALFFTSQDTGYAGTSGGIYKTTDAGATWANIFPLSQPVNNISFKDGIAFATAGSGDIYISSDNGNTWTPMVSPVTVTLQDIHIVNHNLAFISGNSGTILKYTNTTGLTVYQEASPLQCWQDPYSGELTIQWNEMNGGDVNIQLIDMSGRVVVERRLNSEPGTGQISITGSLLPGGIYLVKADSGKKQAVRKISLSPQK